MSLRPAGWSSLKCTKGYFLAPEEVQQMPSM